MNQPRRSDSVGAPKEPETQGCAHCGAKFGLVRHYYLRKHFCAKTCLADYKAGRRREVDTRLRQWWRHLQSTNTPEGAPNSDK
jgi:hypothetical protein